MENINTFAEGLLKDPLSRAALCAQYENDVDFLEKNFEGKIESEQPMSGIGCYSRGASVAPRTDG